MTERHQSPIDPRFRRFLRLLLVAATGIGLALGTGGGEPLDFLNQVASPPVLAQSLRPEQAAAAVYERLPYLPQENQYIYQETGEVAEEHTLIGRLIRYHQDLKKRPTRFRLDWKLTLADYLGVNEPMQAERYPGNSTLTSNPLEGDRQAIGRLNRRQREELVDLLANLYRPPQERSPAPAPSPDPSPLPAAPDDGSSKPPLSQPGDAQLLLP